MTKTYDEPGGSIQFQKGGERPTKKGGTWQAPDSLLIDYHGNKSYITIESLRFFLMCYEKHEDLRQVVDNG